MSLQKLTVCAAATAALAASVWVIPTQASMYPIARAAKPYIQHVDCAVGFHLGPVGTCVVGAPDAPPPPPVVVDRAAPPDQGCETKSITRRDSEGNSETRTKTNC